MSLFLKVSGLSPKMLKLSVIIFFSILLLLKNIFYVVVILVCFSGSNIGNYIIGFGYININFSSVSAPPWFPIMDNLLFNLSLFPPSRVVALRYLNLLEKISLGLTRLVMSSWLEVTVRNTLGDSNGNSSSCTLIPRNTRLTGFNELYFSCASGVLTVELAKVPTVLLVYCNDWYPPSLRDATFREMFNFGILILFINK